MPRKRPVIEENPPVDSSEEEEEEEEEQNDAVNEDAEEEQKQETPVKKSTVNSSSSDDDSESDADSEETQPSPAASAFTIKQRGDAAAAAAATVAYKKTTASKRKAIFEETESQNDNNKAKAAASGSNGRGGGEPRGREGKVQRLWTEDDEIALLKGTSEYRSIKGSDPSADVGGFYEYIKKSLDLSFELSKPQMVDKIYRLKKKYKANVEKAGEDDPVFTKPHEQRAFELSKKIWGPEAVVLNGVGVDAKKGKNLKTTQTKPPLPLPSIGVTLGLPNRKNPNFYPEKKAKVLANGEVEVEAVVEAEDDTEVGDGEENGGKVGSDIWSKFPYLGSSLDMEKALAWPEFEKSFVRDQMCLIGSNKAKELEETWRDLQEKELELFLKKIDVVKQQAQLALDVLKASKS